MFSQSVNVATGRNYKFCSTELRDETTKGCSLKERKQWRQPRGLLNGARYLKIMTFVHLCMYTVTFFFSLLVATRKPCMCTPVNCVFLHVHRLNLRVFIAMKQLVKRVHLPKAKATASNASCFCKLTVTFCTCTKARCFLFSLPAKKAQPRLGILVCLWLVVM